MTRFSRSNPHLFLHLVVAVATVCGGAVGCASSKNLEDADDDDDQQTASATDDKRQAHEYEPAERESSSSSGDSEQTGDDTSTRQEPGSTDPAAPPPAEKSTDEKSISDAQLDEFARISKKVKRVQMTTKKKIRSAESRKEAETYKKKAKQKILAIFEDADMTRKEYDQIARRLRSDRELQRRFKKRVGGG